MLDVGANFGYYSFYAAKMGCRVVAWEPIPIFRAFVEAGLALNNLTHRVHLRSNVVSDVGGKSIQMTVPQRGIWGTASVGGLNVDPSIRSTTYTVTARSETLDQVSALIASECIGVCLSASVAGGHGAALHASAHHGAPIPTGGH